MQKRMDSEERNKKILTAIEKIEKAGEKPNYKNVAQETGFSETYIFKLISKEMKKPKGQRIPKILKLKIHNTSKRRVDEILKAVKEITGKGEEISYKAIADKIGLSESYVFKLYQKYNLEQRILEKGKEQDYE